MPTNPRFQSSAFFLAAALACLAAQPLRAAAVDVSAAEHVKPALPDIPDRTFTLPTSAPSATVAR